MKSFKSTLTSILTWSVILISTLFSLQLQAQYCIPASGTGSDGVYISRFEINTIDNPSGNDGFTNYTMNTTLLQGWTYPYTITHPNPHSVTVYHHVYIDINNDGDYFDAGELVGSGNTSGGVSTGSINFPLNGNLNMETGLRIVVAEAPITGPCMVLNGGNPSGETENYMVDIPETIGDDEWDVWVSAGGFNAFPSGDLCELAIEPDVTFNLCPTSPSVPNTPYRVYLEGRFREIGTTNRCWADKKTQTLLMDHNSLNPISFALGTDGCNTINFSNGSFKIDIFQNLIQQDTECVVGQYDQMTMYFTMENCNIISDMTYFSYENGEGSIYRTVDETTNKFIDRGNVLLFPNPTSGEVKIVLNVKEEGPLNIEVFDAMGRKKAVLVNNAFQSIGNFEHTSDLSHLEGGIYMVAIRHKDHVEVVRLVKTE